MSVKDYKPTELLRPFIKTYRIIESQDERVNRVLPNTSISIAFRYKGQTNYTTNNTIDRIAPVTISGLRKSVRLINYLQDTATLVVLFKETGASAFFKEPLYKLFEESVSLDNYINQYEVSAIQEQLAGAPSDGHRIAAVNDFLLSKLRSCTSDKLISSAVDRISAEKGMIKMKELADTFCLSTDAFEKRFRRIVGTSPKQFSNIIRLKAVTSQGQHNQLLSDLAFDAGYYDQPHFNKDFKLFTGQNPTAFFKSASFW